MILLQSLWSLAQRTEGATGKVGSCGGVSLTCAQDRAALQRVDRGHAAYERVGIVRKPEKSKRDFPEAVV